MCVCLCAHACVQMVVVPEIVDKLRGLSNVRINHVIVKHDITMSGRISCNDEAYAMRDSLILLRALPCAPARLSVPRRSCSTAMLNELNREAQWPHVSAEFMGGYDEDW